MKSAGTVELKGPEFVLHCPPQILIRLKRVFHGVAKGARPVRMAATPETARDLMWFLERYDLEVDPGSRPELERLCQAHRDRERLVQRVLHGDLKPRRFELGLPLRPYQAQAAELALQSGSLLLADDVGLGKTATAIGAIVALGARPALVVTLTHLPGQWKRELERFAPGISVHVLKKGTPYPIGDPDVIVSNYHKLAGWSGELAGKVGAVVFDEAQELRRTASNKYAAAQAIAAFASLRMGLTATPIYNYGAEFHAVLSVIAPDEIGSREEFGREWCSGNYADKARIADPRAFGLYVRDRGLMLRRTRRDVGREIPPVQTIPHLIDCDRQALDDVEGDLVDLARVIADTDAQPFERMQAGGQLDYRLRQATGLAKARHVAAFVRLLVESGERVVLYGWHRGVYAIWQEQLADLRPAFFTGAESPAAKEEARRRFVDGESKVLVISLRSGAGLDGLQHVSRTVVFGEIDWSPGIHVQCVGRVARDGQEEPVTTYYLLAEHGSDPVIADALGVKRGQLEPALDPDAELVTKLEVDPNHVRRLAESYLARSRRSKAKA